MISQTQIDACVAVAKRYGATRVLLFGSAKDDPANARDIDLVCEGVADRSFVRMGAEMDRAAGVPVDVVDAADDTPFSRYVAGKGRLLHA
jgi:predicted nucleotidyltransferase